MERDERLEYLRVISCCFVILGHIANWYMRTYPNLPTDSYVCSLLFNGICRVSVPIFFMISGALILGKPTDYKKSISRTRNMLIKTVMWTLIYIVWDYLYLGEAYNLKTVFTNPVRVHFWFMYVMVGICITTPLWQKLVSGDSKSLMHYFSVGFMVVLASQFVLNTLKMTPTYEIPLWGNSCYVGYFIMGYVLRRYSDDIRIKKSMCIAVLVISVVSTDLFTWLYTNKIGTHCETFSDFRTFFIALASMSVFLMAMKMKMPKQRIWITAISKHSFNIYMMHVFFLDILQQNIDPAKVSSWWGTPVFFIFMFSLSFAMSWIYEKAKGKKINAI